MFSAFTFHKSDKPLSEKGLAGVLYYSEKSSRDIAQFAENNRVSANSLMAFGALLGDDFNDVTNKLGNMLLQWSNIMMEFSDSIDQYRDMLKIIPIKEASLQPSRDQKRKIREKMDQLQGSLSSMDKLAHLEDQLKQLEKITELDEIEMDNFKRINTSKALYTLLEGMRTMAGKTNIISTSSKYIVDELHVIPLKLGHERPIYQAEERTKKLVDQVIKSLDIWDQKTYDPFIQKKQLPPIPIKSTSTPISITTTNSNDTVIVLPPRHISLEEQHKQYSFYKPDEKPDDDDDGDDEEQQLSDTSISNQPYLTQPNNTHKIIPLQNNEAGFSNIYLNSSYQQPQEKYLPNKEYEELASSYNSDAVFRGNRHKNDDCKKSQRHDAGGFVLPSFNPNYIYPSTSTKSSKSEPIE